MASSAPRTRKFRVTGIFYSGFDEYDRRLMYVNISDAQHFLGKADEVLKVIDEDEDIAVLVLAAGVGKEGPGPLVSSIVATGSASFPIPITIVPGNLSDEELDALS